MLKIGHVCSGEKLSIKLHEQFLFLPEKKMKLRCASVHSAFPLHWPVWRTPCLRPCLLLLIDFFSCACLSHQGSGVLNGPGKSGSPHTHSLPAEPNCTLTPGKMKCCLSWGLLSIRHLADIYGRRTRRCMASARLTSSEKRKGESVFG